MMPIDVYLFSYPQQASGTEGFHETLLPSFVSCECWQPSSSLHITEDSKFVSKKYDRYSMSGFRVRAAVSSNCGTIVVSQNLMIGQRYARAQFLDIEVHLLKACCLHKVHRKILSQIEM